MNTKRKNPSSSKSSPNPYKHQTEEQIIDEEEEEKGREKTKFEWDFKLSILVSSNSTNSGSDTLGTIEFDPTDTLIATGGIARKIKVYNINTLSSHQSSDRNGSIAVLDHVTACDYNIYTPAKLSSLRWKPGSSGRVIGSGDYDGVVTEYDLETKIPIFERDEHGGRRVWSVDYSHSDPVVGASGSDDGTIQMWDPRCDVDGGRSVAKVQPSVRRSSVCCVEFDPFRGAMLAVGCADRRGYVYDVRKMVDPVAVLIGHEKTVSYARFLDSNRIVTAGTDGCLKQWSTGDSSAIRTYEGHVNNRNFVGLSVWRYGGLLGCGSENNQVFVYDKRWAEPIWVHGFDRMASRVESGAESRGESRGESGFVSSVCWRQVCEDECNLVAGGSDGVLQVFVGTKKSSSSSS